MCREVVLSPHGFYIQSVSQVKHPSNRGGSGDSVDNGIIPSPLKD